MKGLNFKRIDKWSLRYALLRFYVRFCHNKIFYRKICITGKENLPKDTPLFFAPNHQNALMDALIILCSIKQQAVFIARADIFKSSLLAKILISFKILPAYRIRDGRENLKKNEEIFDISVKILENKNILALFPETTHTNLRHLQELKKGVQRIVFQAEEKNDFKLGIKIIPIGIYFKNYWNFQSDVHVNFGKPIDLNEYNEIYRSNPQKAMLTLRDGITEKLKPLVIHIENLDYYNLYEFLREFYNKRMLQKLSLPINQKNKFVADKKIIENLDESLPNNPENFIELDTLIKDYQEALKSKNLRHWVVEKNESSFKIIFKSILLTFTLPIFIFGFINNIIPYSLPKSITKKLKDKQFTSSIVFVIGLISFPIFYLILFGMIWLFTYTWWIKFAYLISMPITGLWAFKIHRGYIKLKAQIKFLLIRQNAEGQNLIQLETKITALFENLIGKNIK